MSDFKEELKIKKVEGWAITEHSVPSYIANDVEIVTANPGTFTRWIKDYIVNSICKINELRQANNDLQKIIDSQEIDAMYNTLAENMINSVQDLKNHFSCVSAADDVKEVERLKAEIERLKKEAQNLPVNQETADILSQIPVYCNDSLRNYVVTFQRNLTEIERLKAENAQLKRNEIDKTDCEPIIDNSYTGQIASLKEENTRLEKEVSNLNCLLDDKEDAQFEQPVVTLATLQDYCQAVVDAEKALRRFMEGGN